MTIQKTLNVEFEKRRVINPRFSQRAFASFLGIAPSTICNVMNGKKGVSRPVAMNIADKLGFSPEKRDQFCDLADASFARSPKRKEAAKQRIKNRSTTYDDLDLDRFKTVSSWYHWAILEWPRLKSVSSNPHEIGKKLGISARKAKEAVDRLLKIGLLEKRDQLLHTKSYRVKSENQNDAIRSLHRSILNMAKNSAEVEPVDKRNIGAIFLAFKKENYNDAVKEIIRFRNEFDQRFSCHNTDGDEIFCLATQFFKIHGGKDSD